MKFISDILANSPSPKKLRYSIKQKECIFINDPLSSEKDCFELNIQRSGNLVITRTRDKEVIWGTNTSGNSIDKACLLGEIAFHKYQDR